MHRAVAILSFIAVLMTSSTAIADSIPRYDPEAYCKQVSDISGGSAMIFNGCMDMEQEAYDKRKDEWASIAPKTASYCDDVARVSGGSYMMLDGCLDMEADAVATTPGFKF
jgi:hypothetical protein